MATFAELVLESIESNNYPQTGEDNYPQTGEGDYHHTGIITKINHKNKTIHVNPDKSHVTQKMGKFAKYGTLLGGISFIHDADRLRNRFGGGFADSLGGRLIGGGAIAGGVGALAGLYQKNKEKRKIHRLLKTGYKIQYDE